MLTQLNTLCCGMAMRHDPHAYVTTTNGTAWLVICAGNAQTQTNTPSR